jgi:uncharacterized protein YjiS (DUF1127 family)
MSLYSAKASTSNFRSYDQIFTLVAAVRQRLLRWRHRQVIISELGEYSPRELTELGISQADIPHVAASAFSDDVQ